MQQKLHQVPGRGADPAVTFAYHDQFGDNGVTRILIQSRELFVPNYALLAFAKHLRLELLLAEEDGRSLENLREKA